MSERRRTDPLPLGGGDEPVLEGSDGAGADARSASRPCARTSLRAGSSRTCPRERGLDRSRPASRSSPSDVLGESEGQRGGPPPAPLRRPAPSSTCRSSSSSAARPAPASRRSRPRSPTGSGSRGSPRPTSSARRCARSSAREFMPSIHYSSFEAGRRCAAPRTRRSTRSCTASSTRRGTCSSACDAAIERALAEGWSMVLEGVHLVPGMIRADRGRARRPVRARDRGRGRAREPLLDPRRRLRRRPRASTSTSTAAATSAYPGLHRRAGAAERRAGDREQATWSARSSAVMELVLSGAERLQRV